MMRLGPDGEKMIKGFEVLSLNVYHGAADAPDVWTIGWGAIRYLDGTRCVRATPPITEPQAEALFLRDTHAPIACIEQTVDRQLSQNQIDALATLIFNIGVTAFEHSTLLRNINRAEQDRIEVQWLRWDRAAGREVGGLLKRRKAELALYLA